MLNYTKLKHLRESRSVTQAELAEAVGVSPTAISYFENGLKDPKLVVAKRIAKFFGVTVDELLTENE